MWRPVAELFDLLVDIEEQLDRFIESGDPRAGALDADPNAPVALMLAISSLWDLLVNLGRMYEELCREWFLPTYLGDLTNP